jgi:hypothetical protein
MEEPMVYGPTHYLFVTLPPTGMNACTVDDGLNEIYDACCFAADNGIPYNQTIYGANATHSRSPRC